MFIPEATNSTADYAAVRYQKPRRHQRFDLQFPVRLSFAVRRTMREIEATTLNVSACSLLARVKDPIALHTPVRLMMTVQVRAPRTIFLWGEGKVVRLEKIGRTGFAVAISCEQPIIELENDLPATG